MCMHNNYNVVMNQSKTDWDEEFHSTSDSDNMIIVLGGAIAGGGITLLLLTGALIVTLCYWGRQLRKKDKYRSTNDMKLVKKFMRR